jgi:hypothetical protein
MMPGMTTSKRTKVKTDPKLVAWVAQRSRDVALARQRIGMTTDDRCRWLLEDFCARDPATLSTAERAMMRDNMLALAQVPFPPYGGPEDDARLELPPLPDGGGTFALDDPPDAELRPLWQKVVNLTCAHRAPAPLPAVKEVLCSAPGRMANGRLRLGRRRASPDFQTTLLHRVADLLEHCERLRECPECHMLFVMRRRQERHPKCARKARDARRPSRQPENRKRPKRS